jgi:serralysin
LKLNTISCKLTPVIATGIVWLLCEIAAMAGFAGMAEGQVSFGVKPYICVRNFYVNGATGKDVSTSGSQSYPWKTIQYANDHAGLKAGDCVNVAAGTYAQPGTQGMGLTLSTSGNANIPTGYVTYIGEPNHATRITGSASTFSLVRITGSYIIIDGFDLDGTGTPDYVVSNNPPSSGGAGHHLMVLNSLIHGSGGGGVGFEHTDYFTVIGNTVYNTSRTSPYQESGISIYEPAAIQNFTPILVWDIAAFHIVVANNIVYNNAETMAGAHSDGNGIIIDDWLHTQQSPNTPYPYGGLVQSNLSYNNGGKGIQVFLSLNVTVANNTVFNNNLDLQNNGTWRGELDNAASNNVTWINNIAWSQPISSDVRQYNTAVLMGTYGGYSLDNVVWKENLTFNGTSGNSSASLPTPAQLSAFLSANKAGVNPLLQNLQPLSNSPVISSGSPTPAYPPISLYGNAIGTPPDIGAY